MRLKITHRTEYAYDSPISYGLQRLRLVARSGPTQTVSSWSLEIEGAREEVRFRDHFGNDTRLVSMEGRPTGRGRRGQRRRADDQHGGRLRPHQGMEPLWLYQQATPLTQPGEAVRALAAEIGPGNDIARLHDLMNLIADRVTYRIGSTDAFTTAENALVAKSGVCQDHAHIFISAARLLGFPSAMSAAT